MAESLLPYALTTVARIKSRLAITVSAHDTILLFLINAATDYLEGECNRRFKETSYSNEVYSQKNGSELVLRQTPVSEVTSVQYRAGLKSNPSWTEFIVDDWELEEDGQSGIIAIRGILEGTNLLRVSYKAGYKIDFTKYGDPASHNLPADLTDCCERLTVKLFKRRESEGKEREGLNSAMTIWKDLISPEDTETINRYRRVTFF